ncbi:MAG: hypothetical protein ACO37W_17545 [Prochlorotrichaceae cyanobacterium]
MSWGLILALVVISIYEPAQQRFLDFIEKNQLENRPFIIAVVLGIWVVIFSGAKLWQRQLQKEKRQSIYQGWAHAHGWNYSPAENKDLWRCYGFLYGMPGYAVRSSSDQKQYPCVIDVLAGQWQNYEVKAFTYYSRSVRRVRSGKSHRTKVSHYYLGMTLLHVKGDFPKLYLRPFHWSDHLAKFLGVKNPPGNLFHKTVKIKGQGQRSQQTYQIVTANLTFADQFLQTTMLDGRVKHEKVHFEIDRDVLVVYQEGALQPETIEANLEFLHQIHQQIRAQSDR